MSIVGIPPNLKFYFAAGLTFVGAASAATLALRAKIECEPRHTLLLGESADVKRSTALRRTAQFFESAEAILQPAPSLNWGVESAEGLARKLNESPAGVVLARDEMVHCAGRQPTRPLIKTRGSPALAGGRACASIPFASTSCTCRCTSRANAPRCRCLRGPLQIFEDRYPDSHRE